MEKVTLAFGMRWSELKNGSMYMKQRQENKQHRDINASCRLGIDRNLSLGFTGKFTEVEKVKKLDKYYKAEKVHSWSASFCW